MSANAAIRSLAADYSGVDAVSDVGSMVGVTTMTGAQEYWKAGYTGKGVGVAVIDTGVAPVDGLTVSGKVVNGPDLSFDSQDAEQALRRPPRARHPHGRHHRRPRERRGLEQLRG